MGGARDAGVLQHHAAPGQDLRQRGRGAGHLHRIRRSLRDFLQGPRREIPGAEGRDTAEDLSSAGELAEPPPGPKTKPSPGYCPLRLGFTRPTIPCVTPWRQSETLARGSCAEWPKFRLIAETQPLESGAYGLRFGCLQSGRSNPGPMLLEIGF